MHTGIMPEENAASNLTCGKASDFLVFTTAVQQCKKQYLNIIVTSVNGLSTGWRMEELNIIL